MDTDPFVPALSKSMANRGKVISDDDQRPLRERAEEETERAVSRGEFQIVYPGPYAHYLYRGKLGVDPDTGSSWAKEGATKVITDKNLVFSQATAPQAQAEWFEASKAQNMKKWIRTYERAFKQKK